MKSETMQEPRRSHLMVYNGVYIKLNTATGKYEALGSKYDSPEAAKKAVDRFVESLPDYEKDLPPWGV